MGSGSELKAGLIFVKVDVRIINNMPSNQECIKIPVLLKQIFQKSAMKWRVHPIYCMKEKHQDSLVRSRKNETNLC